jgi:hypothetical protein
MKLDVGTDPHSVPSYETLLDMVVAQLTKLGQSDKPSPQWYLKAPPDMQTVWRLDVDHVLAWQPGLVPGMVAHWRSSVCNLPAAMVELFKTPFHDWRTGKYRAGIECWAFPTREIERYRQIYVEHVRNGGKGDDVGLGLVDTCIAQILYPASGSKFDGYGTGCGLHPDLEYESTFNHQRMLEEYGPPDCTAVPVTASWAPPLPSSPFPDMSDLKTVVEED